MVGTMKIWHLILGILLVIQFTCAEEKKGKDAENDIMNTIEQDEEERLKQLEVDRDPCSNKHCGAGRVCGVNEQGKAECICIPECPEESDLRRKVCSNHNETWPSDCAVYQQRCFCEKSLDGCRGPKFRHVHIEYYGACREHRECLETEMADFPRRMRDWLYNVMRDLADRRELRPAELALEREAEQNLTRRWTNAAIWKWCDLDDHPHDRAISRHELFPIRAPLMALEHCIGPFLDQCDADDDHKITLNEWGKCLEVDIEEIDDRCEELKGIKNYF